MTANIYKLIGACGLAFAAGCGAITDDTSRIEVTESNALGVTTLQTERTIDHGNDVFTLRGLSADEHELAHVRLTVGTIEDLSRWMSGADDLGSEVVVTVAGHAGRTVSRAVEHIDVVASSFDDAGAQQFLQLAEVSSVLEHQAQIFVHPDAETGGEQNYTDPTGSVQSCSSAYLLTSPIAGQCCYQVYNTSSWTIFVNPAQALVKRMRNPYGTGCRGLNGTSSCVGAACYYGPQGFARATITPPPSGSPYGFVGNDYLSTPVCPGSHFATPQTPDWGNVTGSGATGQGCPGGASGAYAWDY